MVLVLDKGISGLALHFLVKGTAETYVAEQQRTQTSFSAK